MPDREKVIRGLECCIVGDGHSPKCELCPYTTIGDDTCDSMDGLFGDALALLKAEEAVTGETSDGYHTFNELYHHRAVLFSVIVANYPDMAWKAKKHHDGTMYDGMFIVGIETPDGQATYHYDIDPYWDMFKCRVLDNAPEWDGHTPAQAIERIGRLATMKAQEAVEPILKREGWNKYHTSDRVSVVHCRECEYYYPEPYGDVPMCYRGLGYMGEDDYCSLAERREDEQWEP